MMITVLRKLTWLMAGVFTLSSFATVANFDLDEHIRRLTNLEENTGLLLNFENGARFYRGIESSDPAFYLGEVYIHFKVNGQRTNSSLRLFEFRTEAVTSNKTLPGIKLTYLNKKMALKPGVDFTIPEKEIRTALKSVKGIEEVTDLDLTWKLYQWGTLGWWDVTSQRDANDTFPFWFPGVAKDDQSALRDSGGRTQIRYPVKNPLLLRNEQGSTVVVLSGTTPPLSMVASPAPEPEDNAIKKLVLELSKRVESLEREHEWTLEELVLIEERLSLVIREFEDFKSRQHRLNEIVVEGLNEQIRKAEGTLKKLRKEAKPD